MGDNNKHLLNCSENLKLRNAVTREERLPLLSVSGVSQRWSQYFRAAVSRVAGFQMHSFPRSGAEAQNTLALRKSSIFVNPRPGRDRHTQPIICSLRCHQNTATVRNDDL